MLQRGWQEWTCEYTFADAHVTIGGYTLDISPTKHVVMMLLAALLLCIVLIGARARTSATRERVGRRRDSRPARGDRALPPQRDHHPGVGRTRRRAVRAVLLTVFFFILFCNLLGLVPYGSTPTGNVSVTATLAIIAFVVIEVAGMRALGKGYISTIIYWPHDMPSGAEAPMTIIMTPVEILGKFTKPFALTIRLFANMIAGHVMVLALIGLIFMFGRLDGDRPGAVAAMACSSWCSRSSSRSSRRTSSRCSCRRSSGRFGRHITRDGWTQMHR